MATFPRQVIVSPPYAPRRLLFDFAQQNPLLNVLFVSPGNPVFPSEHVGFRPKPLWNSAVYFDPPNVTIRLPPYVPGTPIFPPDFGPKLVGPARNSAVNFDAPNVTISGQGALAGNPIQPVDLTPRMVARQPQDIQYGPNLSLFILNSNPYIPVDVGSPIPAARRNASLYFDSPNLAILLGAGQVPIFPPDLSIRLSVRQPLVFDAPNLVMTLPTGAAPIVPIDLGIPTRLPLRCITLYEAQPTLLPTLLSAPPLAPPFQYDLGFRYMVRRNPTPIEWIEPQVKALFSLPILLANIPNLSYRKNTGVQVFQAGLSFSGATSYSISPALDAGITFNTSTAEIDTDTHVATAATHGPYTITATNVNGSQASNAFTITVSQGNYLVDGARLIESTTAIGTTYVASGPNVTRDTPESKDLT